MPTMPDARAHRGPSKPGGGKRKNRDARREQRRREAEARQAKYDALSLTEKIALARPGSKQYGRLMALAEGVTA